MGFGHGEILRAVNDGVTLARAAKPARLNSGGKPRGSSAPCPLKSRAVQFAA
jgi:hypothetical protein